MITQERVDELAAKMLTVMAVHDATDGEAWVAACRVACALHIEAQVAGGWLTEGEQFQEGMDLSRLVAAIFREHHDTLVRRQAEAN